MRCVKKGDWNIIKCDVLEGTVRETQLFNLADNPDGLLDQGQIDLLEGIGDWFAQNGDSIYDTVPWKIFAEGHTEKLEYFQYRREGKGKTRGVQPYPKILDYTDVRFTRNDEARYANVLGITPDGVVKMTSLSTATSVSDVNEIVSVELLGYVPVEWERTGEHLAVELPEALPNDWALSFRIKVKGELDKSTPAVDSTKLKMPKQT